MAIITNLPVLNADDGVWDDKINQSLTELETAIEADRSRLSTLEARPKFYIGTTAPTDTSFVWIDTSI